VKWPAIIAIALMARTATADPSLPRLLTAPTAWLPAEGAVIGTAGLDHRGDGSIDVGYGLGGLAEVDVGADTDLRACVGGPCGATRRATAQWLGHAAFRVGARQDAWFAGQPALLVGVTTGFGHPRATEAYVIASREVSVVRLHAGAAVLDARVGDARMGLRVRPVAGLELMPPQYPKTTLLTDVAWVPRFEPDHATLEWVGGVGVRYQALRWSSIELDVRHRGGEDLGATTVFVRINGVWGGRSQGSK
jgi:hypothetical protein